MTRRVAITGLGFVTPLGTDVQSTWAGLIAGRSGAGPITRFDPVELVMAFEKEFDIDIPDEEAEKLRTVGQALQYLHEKMGK